MVAAKIIGGIIAIGLGGFGILNSIFLWVPMFVQGHPVPAQPSPKQTALRVAGGIISAIIMAAGIAMIAS